MMRALLSAPHGQRWGGPFLKSCSWRLAVPSRALAGLGGWRSRRPLGKALPPAFLRSGLAFLLSLSGRPAPGRGRPEGRLSARPPKGPAKPGCAKGGARGPHSFNVGATHPFGGPWPRARRKDLGNGRRRPQGFLDVKRGRLTQERFTAAVSHGLSQLARGGGRALPGALAGVSRLLPFRAAR